MLVHLAISMEVVMEARVCPPQYIFADVGPAPVAVENSSGDPQENTYTSPTLVRDGKQQWQSTSTTSTDFVHNGR